MTENTKPTIKFGKFYGWDTRSAPIRAFLGDVQNHPLLGNQPEVTTSAVVKIEYAVGETGQRTPILIETLNTRYEFVQ